MKDYFIKLIPVMVSGAIGTALRFSLCYFAERTFAVVEKNPFLGTLVVNFTGCFAIGVLGQMFLYGNLSDVPQIWKTTLFVGLLGGYTTFSTFSLQVFDLARVGEFGAAALLAMLSLLVCLVATFFGVWLATRFS